jgi:hypothetical protein
MLRWSSVARRSHPPSRTLSVTTYFNHGFMDGGIIDGFL